MTFRSRLLVAITIGALLPLGVAVVGLRRAIDRRITAMYDQRLAGEARTIRGAIDEENRAIAEKLVTLMQSLKEDDRFRVGAVRRDPHERGYVLDYAERAMRLAGLSMFQIQDEAGRIVSSGHFSREYDQLDATSLRLLIKAGTAGAITRARTPEGFFAALARVDSLLINGKRFYLTGGVTIDDAYLARFARGDSIGVSMELGAAGAGPGPGITQAIPMQFVDATADTLKPAQFVIAQSRTELAVLLRDANQLFLISMLMVVASVVVLGIWLSSHLSRPLADLASAASRIDLDGGEVTVAAARDDEIGALARRLSALTKRLGVSAERLRSAERRATVGDMARQVNHDIKNGLIPIRNVLRHLGDVNDQHPGELPTAFTERRGTLDASVTYLDTLARQYARLTPRIDRTPIDVNAVVQEAAANAAIGSDHRVSTRLAGESPILTGDRVMLRRILDNLIRNGLESLDGKTGEVTITTTRNDENILLTVSDTGRGMAAEELAHVFDDFFTTKEHGTGLGLSVVRRLTSDLGGSVRVESAPGRGTTFTLELPA